MKRPTKHHQARYAHWSGNPNGTKADPERCATEVWTKNALALTKQCSRKCGHGPDGAFCKQHAQMVTPEQNPGAAS